jgi:hypothetical protein
MYKDHQCIHTEPLPFVSRLPITFVLLLLHSPSESIARGPAVPPTLSSPPTPDLLFSPAALRHSLLREG